jgi:hypothetical protein
VKLTSIVLYPVKSCRGIEVDRARVEKRGLTHDRRWMVADEHGRFVSQREAPRLSLVDVAIEGDAIHLSSAGAGEARVPITTDDGDRRQVGVWGRHTGAIVHDEASRWMSAFVGRDVSVVHLPDTIDSPMSSSRSRPGDEVSFADGYPLLVATEESLADLGTRIEARGSPAVPMVRFRPNVVVRGAPAWDEDAWAALAIGSIALRAPKPCERCVMTTIDPATARLGPEPLRTLATFRRRDHGVWFGVNLVPDTLGEIRVGDAVRITGRTEPPAFDVLSDRA